MKPYLFAFLAYAGACSASFACGPCLPPSYLDKAENPAGLQISFGSEVELIARDAGLLQGRPPKHLKSTLSSEEAELSDFREALQKAMPGAGAAEKAALLAAYAESMKTARAGRELAFKAPDGELLEFELYLKGWQEMTSQPKEAPKIAPKSWAELLALPAERRRCRTVWTRYMLGNFLSGTGKPEVARKQYELCRESALAGFADSDGLAYLSYSRQFRSEKDPVERLKAGVRAWSFYKESDDKDMAEATLALLWQSLKPALKAEDQLRLLDDPLAREILSAKAMKCDDPDALNSFLLCLEGRKVKNGERAAYIAYKSGNSAIAKSWLEATPDSSLLKRWVAGKIFRQEGKYPEAAQEFREWLQLAASLPPKSPEKLRLEFPYEEGWMAENDVGALLGSALVHKSDFLDALHAFMLAASWPDAAFVAERLLETPELKRYVDANCPATQGDGPQGPSPERSQFIVKAQLRYLFARRLLREGDENGALAYMPEKALPMLGVYLNELNASRKPGDNNKRALHLYNAAKAMRVWGLEIAGTEMQPDMKIYDGDYGWYSSGKELMEAEGSPLALMAKKHAPSPDKRFHYRFAAAELHKQAASLATDSAIKTMALYAGGSYIEKRSPKEADILYKRLVRECRPEPLAMLCDKRRWFEHYVGKPILEEIESPLPQSSPKELRAIMDKSLEGIEIPKGKSYARLLMGKLSNWTR